MKVYNISVGILSIIGIFSSMVSFFSPVYKISRYTLIEDQIEIAKLNNIISFGLLFMGLVFAVLFLVTTPKR